MTKHQLPHVVLVGGGFGGLAAARALRIAPVQITLIDRRITSLSAVALSGRECNAGSGRHRCPHSSVASETAQRDGCYGRVTGVGVANLRVLIDYPGQPDTPLQYDYLILATGAPHSYFGNEFAAFAPGMKTLADAESVRAKVLKGFETAEIEENPSKHQDLLTFVLVGGGPTGVEMAGALAELRRFTLKSDFRRIDPSGCASSSQKPRLGFWEVFPKNYRAKHKRAWKALALKCAPACRSQQSTNQPLS
jgi:NADH dehydrogenase